MLNFFMGKNTPDRQKFIIDNLRVEKDDAIKADTDDDSVEAASNAVLEEPSVESSETA
jgi:topoisomerase-4 subunit B